MAFSRFIKLPDYKRFNFQTRYYDEEKEEFEQRVEEAKRKAGDGEKVYVPNIKGQMRSSFKKDSIRRSRQSNIRLILIITALIAIAYYILFY
jgi:hypothetical protein